jgi:MFS superfamily sulfate permease-like transporter
VNFTHARHLLRDYGALPALIWAVTLVLVVAEDLLTGVLVGIALSMIELLPNFRRLRLRVDEHEQIEGRSTLTLSGAATFVALPKLSARLEALPSKGPVSLDLTHCSAIDHTCSELLKDWLQRRRAGGGQVEVFGGSDKMAEFARA